MIHERVAIVGSRDWPQPKRIIGYVAFLPIGTVVVSGTEPSSDPSNDRGVDQVAIRAARKFGFETKVFPADWKRFGKSAGPRRNTDIVNYCTRLVAFWDGISRGTKDSIDKAAAAGKPVGIIGINLEWIQGSNASIQGLFQTRELAWTKTDSRPF